MQDSQKINIERYHVVHYVEVDVTDRETILGRFDILRSVPYIASCVKA